MRDMLPIRTFAKSRIFRNMASLGLLQAANSLIPLIVIPVITRILGADLFGRVSYAQNIVAYLTLLVNYGFEYSATRQIALCQGDKGKTRRLFWAVITMKICLLVLSLIVLWGLSWGMERIQADPRLYWYTALINIGIALFPTWYLQGVQEMEKMAWGNFIIRLSGAVAVILLVREAGQYRLYPLLMSVAGIVTGGGVLAYTVRHFGLGCWRTDRESLRETAAAGLPVFLNNVFISFYALANMTILGLYADDTALGHYSGAQRIIMALNTFIIMPVSTALFPEMSRRMSANPDEGRRFFRLSLLWASAAAGAASVVTFAAAPLLVRLLLGPDFAESTALLRWMSPLPLLVMAATIVTVQGLYGRGLQRYAPWVGLALSIVCIVMNFSLVPRFGAGGAVWSWITAEILEILIVSIILKAAWKKTCST